MPEYQTQPNESPTEKADSSGSSVCSRPRPKTMFSVRGNAIVPVEISVRVYASSESEAIEMAQKQFKENRSDLIDPNSIDESSAYDWQPTATRE